MIKINVSGSIVSVQEMEPLYSGSVDVHTCHFTFNTSWERFRKSAVFRCNGKAITALIGEDGCCLLPWEILVRKNIGIRIDVGVYGVSADTEILTGVWDSIGVVRDGTELGNDTREPSPDIYQQIMASVQGAEDKVADYTKDMTAYLQRAESAAVVAAGDSRRAVDSAISSASDAQSARDSVVVVRDLRAQVSADTTQSVQSAASAKISEDNALASREAAERAANRAQAEAERVTVPAAVGVYNVILADRVTGERYALIVENGRPALLGVSETLDSVNVNIIDTATGTAYAVAVESGRLILEEV